MQYKAKAPYIVETYWQIDEVLDGDSIIVKNMFKNERKEIRLYGIDAPETKINRKMKEDEEKSHLPAELLLKLGFKALKYVLKVAPPKTIVTIITEEGNFYDYYNRQLGYIILPNGKCLNELILKNGHAKATHKYYCGNLAEYQAINRKAQLKKVGIYRKIRVF
jgi:micrococcal nuclease